MNGTNHEEQQLRPTMAKPSSTADAVPPLSASMLYAGLYVLSGCSQPILMTLCRHAGLADPSSQLYMLFYYIGPAAVVIPLLFEPSSSWPSSRAIYKACGIALFDIVAQSLNYTGASLAGPTIFAIVYSSVTVWTAAFSKLFLGRSMTFWQWIAVVVVFAGLTLTATDSVQLGERVMRGLLLVVIGSMMHALTYVLSESIMTTGEEQLSIQQNCGVQASVAAAAFFLWQCVYTFPRFDENIRQPMQEAQTTWSGALIILLLFAGANLIHALTFMHTLKHFPGGATSAGVMKGLQAVLVFVFTHLLYCGRTGGEEMCFSEGKFLSLITVVGGVICYGVATQRREESGLGHGYEPINSGIETQQLQGHQQHAIDHDL